MLPRVFFVFLQWRLTKWKVQINICTYVLWFQHSVIVISGNIKIFPKLFFLHSFIIVRVLIKCHHEPKMSARSHNLPFACTLNPNLIPADLAAACHGCMNVCVNGWNVRFRKTLWVSYGVDKTLHTTFMFTLCAWKKKVSELDQYAFLTTSYLPNTVNIKLN